MANTYTSLHCHFVFSTKNRESRIGQAIEGNVWEYSGGIARHNGIVPAKIGGIDDRVHLWFQFLRLFRSATQCSYKKGGSSLWFHETFRRSVDRLVSIATRGTFGEESVRRSRDAAESRDSGPGDESPGYSQTIAPRCRSA